MKETRAIARTAAGLLLALTALQPLSAHQASDAYLRATPAADGHWELEIDVALRDLDVMLELDQDADGQLSWGEVRTREAEITAVVQAGLMLQPPRCGLQAAEGQRMALDRKADGSYVRLNFTSACRVADAAQLSYGLMRGIDPTHRGLLRRGGADTPLLSLVPGSAPVPLADGPPPSAGFLGIPGFAGLFADGMHHILIGADHVLFLVCLLLPLVLGRTGEPPSGALPIRALLGLVTAFTLGHSITLGLASWRVVSVPPQVIEPLIAATIAMAAVDNLRPWLGGHRALAALAFGLVHGFGFAGPLLELELSPATLAWSLLQFNLGVEAGQLLVVALTLVLLWPLRHHRPWARRTLAGGSLTAGLLALLWLGERLLGVRWLAT